MRVAGHGQASKAITGQLGAGGAAAGAALWSHSVSPTTTSTSADVQGIIQDMLENDFSAFDTIGLTWGSRSVDEPGFGIVTDGPALLVPPGWLWWATLRVRCVVVGSIVAGDNYIWEVGTENGGQQYLSEPIRGADNVSIDVMGSSNDIGSLVGYDTITAELGTNFKVTFVQLYVQGIQGIAPNEGPPPPSS